MGYATDAGSSLVTKSYLTFGIPRPVAVGQASLSMGFPRQENRSGLPFPSPGDLPNLGFELASLALTGEFFYCSATREDASDTVCINMLYNCKILCIIFTTPYHVLSLFILNLWFLIPYIFPNSFTFQ